MTLRTRFFRLFIGLVVLAVTLIVGFSILSTLTPRWGATPAEVDQPLPGDELLPNPIIDWTNARTIDASPEQVWPWLAQIGDTRGAFYSFTLIEDRVGAITGGSDYKVDYTNANTIRPEWQNPQPGDEIIQGLLKWDRIETGRWLLASSTNPEVMGWTWLWQIAPTADGQRTRLVNRIGIQVMSGIDNPVMSFFIGNGAFIMEQRMMNGLKARAEGWTEPPYQEAVEVGLWFVALIVGVISAVRFVSRRAWVAPLALAVASVLVILVFTFAQPVILVRVLLDLGLVTALIFVLGMRWPAFVGRRTVSGQPV